VTLHVHEAQPLNVLLPADADAFVVWRLTEDPRKPSMTGSWPLIGLVEDSELACGHFFHKKRPADDLTEDENIWSLCLLDNWLWSSNRYVHISSLPVWGTGFTDAEVGVSIQRGQISFFRRLPHDPVWASTGVVMDVNSESTLHRESIDVVHKRLPPSRFLRPVVIGSEDGRVVAEVLGILPKPPSVPTLCDEALYKVWES